MILFIKAIFFTAVLLNSVLAYAFKTGFIYGPLPDDGAADRLIRILQSDLSASTVILLKPYSKWEILATAPGDEQSYRRLQDLTESDLDFYDRKNFSELIGIYDSNAAILHLYNAAQVPLEKVFQKLLIPNDNVHFEHVYLDTTAYSLPLPFSSKSDLVPEEDVITSPLSENFEGWLQRHDYEFLIHSTYLDSGSAMITENVLKPAELILREKGKVTTEHQRTMGNRLTTDLNDPDIVDFLANEDFLRPCDGIAFVKIEAADSKFNILVRHEEEATWQILRSYSRVPKIPFIGRNSPEDSDIFLFNLLKNPDGSLSNSEFPIVNCYHRLEDEYVYFRDSLGKLPNPFHYTRISEALEARHSAIKEKAKKLNISSDALRVAIDEKAGRFVDKELGRYRARYRKELERFVASRGINNLNLVPKTESEAYSISDVPIEKRLNDFESVYFEAIRSSSLATTWVLQDSISFNMGGFGKDAYPIENCKDYGEIKILVGNFEKLLTQSERCPFYELRTLNPLETHGEFVTICLTSPDIFIVGPKRHLSRFLAKGYRNIAFTEELDYYQRLWLRQCIKTKSCPSLNAL